MKYTSFRSMSALVGIALASSAFSQVIDKNATTDETTGSAWSDQVINPILDRTARKVGDLITILISESSVASFAATTSTSKTDDNSVGQSVLKGLFSFLDLGSNKTTNSSGKSNGTGTTTQNGTLRARLTAEVISVSPNGNLVIEGRRLIQVNKDTQTFKLTGVIRRDDISPDNTVLSESIAQAEIRFAGKGQIADRQRRGILTQMLDWLF